MFPCFLIVKNIFTVTHYINDVSIMQLPASGEASVFTKGWSLLLPPEPPPTHTQREEMGRSRTGRAQLWAPASLRARRRKPQQQALSPPPELELRKPCCWV